MKKVIENKKFWKKRNIFVFIVIISLVFIVASGVLLLYFINKRNYNQKYQKNFFDLDTVDKRTGANIYLDLYERPILSDFYAKRNTDLFYIEVDKKYYFIESDLELINEIKLSEYQNGRRIVGNVDKMDDETKKKVVSFVENKLGITLKDSELDNYISFNVFEYNPYYYMFEYFIAVFIASIFVIGCIFNCLKIHRFNKNYKKLTKEELAEINNSVNDKNSIYVDSLYTYLNGIYICDKYMIDTNTLDIYNYLDITQICFKEKYMKGFIAYKMLINFKYTDKFIKTSIVSKDFKSEIEKYIKEKKLNIYTYEEETSIFCFWE